MSQSPHLKNLAYESSKSDDYLSDEEVDEKKVNRRGTIMVVPLFLPQVGWIQIECLSKEKPEDVAQRYLEKFKLGSVFKSILTEAVQKRKK